MEIERLTLEGVLKQIGEPPSAAELAYVPTEQRALFVELRRNNNLLEWLVTHTVFLNNVLAEHDKQLGPAKVLTKVALGALGVGGGIAALWGLLKTAFKP